MSPNARFDYRAFIAEHGRLPKLKYGGNSIVCASLTFDYAFSTNSFSRYACYFFVCSVPDKSLGLVDQRRECSWIKRTTLRR